MDKLPIKFELKIESTNCSAARTALEQVLAEMNMMRMPKLGDTFESPYFKLEITRSECTLK